MASIVKVETLQDTAGNNAIAMQYVSKGTLKAYCDSQNQTNTINESLNQSSQTDTSGGRKTHNWTAAVIRHGYNPNTVVDDTHASVAFVGVLA